MFKLSQWGKELYKINTTITQYIHNITILIKLSPLHHAESLFAWTPLPPSLSKITFFITPLSPSVHDIINEQLLTKNANIYWNLAMV